MGEARAGRKLVISGDTAPCEMTRVAAHDAQLLVHDCELRRRGGRARRRDRPLDRRARPPSSPPRPGVEMLALVHISSRYDVRAVLAEAREAFPSARSRRATSTWSRSRSPSAASRGWSRTAPAQRREPAAGRRRRRRLMLDERLARHLHVESLRHRDLHPEHEPHVLFQASTIGALLDGAYDGDVTFAELAEHGDLGLGTLNALDGEMIALDGRFYRADVDGLVEEIAPEERTPFAAMTWFEPSLERDARGAARPRRAAGRARRGRRRPGGELRAADRRRVRARARPLGPAPAAAVPAAGRGRRRPARVRARPRSRARWSAFASPTTPRGSRSRATTCTSSTPSASAAATCSSAGRATRSPRHRPLGRAARRAAARGRARLGRARRRDRAPRSSAVERQG